MITSKTMRPVLIFTALLTCATLAFSQGGEQSSGSVAKFTSNLARGGFLVSSGVAKHFDPIQVYCNNGPLPNALYSNQGAPYISAVVPGLPGQAATRLPAEFRLNPQEAVVLIGQTPPPAQYFAFQLYLADRVYPPNTAPDFLLDSLGDSANLRTIHTMGHDPFNREVVLIFTADRGTEDSVRAALLSAGYPDATINSLVIPGPMVHFGLDATSDALLISMRTALFKDPTAGDTYVNNPPLMVFRVTPQNSTTPKLFPVPRLRVRGTGYTEMDLVPEMAKLRQAILDKYAGYTPTEYMTQQVANDGYDYIQREVSSLGDTRDTLYLGAGFFPDFNLEEALTLSENDFLIVYGPNHVATGKATYANVNAYASATAKMGMGSVYSPDWEGSADAYLAGDPAADQMYTYKISRACGDQEPYCLKLQGPPPGTCQGFTLGDSTLLGIGFRLYLERTANIGPAYAEILYDRVIKFSPGP